MPVDVPASESVMPMAPATPMSERDATVRDVSVSQSATPTPAQQEEKEDFNSVLWYYRDPNGDEQGKSIARPI